MIEETSDRLTFLPLEKAVDPPAGFLQHFKNHYWVVHPTKGLVFWDKKVMSPQCNTNQSLAERFQRDMYPWAEVRLIPSVFRRINPNDWSDR